MTVPNHRLRVINSKHITLEVFDYPNEGKNLYVSVLGCFGSKLNCRTDLFDKIEVTLTPLPVSELNKDYEKLSKYFLVPEAYIESDKKYKVRVFCSGICINSIHI